MIRPGLLLTAVATVTVPGLLAMMAVLGHEHVAAEAGAAAVALDGAPLSGPSPLASATTPAPVRHEVAGVQGVSGTPQTVLGTVTTGQQAMGLRLLDLAANASLATSYQGTELSSQSGIGGSVTMTSKIWHKAGGPTLVETSDGTASATAPPAGVAVVSSDAASGSPEGVFGVTKDLVAQLGKHYLAVYWGTGSVTGRPASVIELYRSDGSLAARYWLDNRTLLPLGREVFGTTGNVISDDSFVQIRFGPFILPRIGNTSVSLSQFQQAGPSTWLTASSPAKFVTALGRQGWRMPATPPGGLPLYTAASANTANGEVVDLEYTDGLYVVSLFMQRGTLAADMPGWQPVKVAGQLAYVSGHSVTWAGPGFVYTVIADAPPRTVAQIVQAMPGGSPGILARFGRGFARLARMMDPFG